MMLWAVGIISTRALSMFRYDCWSCKGKQRSRKALESAWKRKTAKQTANLGAKKCGCRAVCRSFAPWCASINSHGCQPLTNCIFASTFWMGAWKWTFQFFLKSSMPGIQVVAIARHRFVPYQKGLWPEAFAHWGTGACTFVLCFRCPIRPNGINTYQYHLLDLLVMVPIQYTVCQWTVAGYSHFPSRTVSACRFRHGKCNAQPSTELSPWKCFWTLAKLCDLDISRFKLNALHEWSTSQSHRPLTSCHTSTYMDLSVLRSSDLCSSDSKLGNPFVQ